MAFSVCTELMNVNFCRLVNTGESMCRSPQKNFAYFVPASPAVPSIILFLLLGWIVRWETSGHTDTVLWGAATRISSKQYAVSLCSSKLASPNTSLNSSIVLIWLQLKNSSFILPKRLDFHMVNNLLITVHAFPLHMLTFLSVDEILLPR